MKNIDRKFTNAVRLSSYHTHRSSVVAFLVLRKSFGVIYLVRRKKNQYSSLMGFDYITHPQKCSTTGHELERFQVGLGMA